MYQSGMTMHTDECFSTRIKLCVNGLSQKLYSLE